MTTADRLRSLLFIVVLASPLAAQDADTASVESFYREWFGSGQQGAQAYAGFYAPDGQVFPPNGFPVQGREAIAGWIARSQAERPYVIRPSGITVDEIRFLTPDWVTYRTTLKGERVPKTGGPGSPFETKYVDLLHRNTEGRWEVVYRMWSDNF
jgi:uncharacterized protein (TIGR02246 family)